MNERKKRSRPGNSTSTPTYTPHSTSKKRRTARTFDMTVVWSTVSDKAYPQHELRNGMMITRLAGGIFEFETYRMRWVDEDARWSAEQEDELTMD